MKKHCLTAKPKPILHPAMDDNDIPPLPDYAADLECAEAFGEGACTPEEGITRMQVRIKGLEDEIQAALKNHAHELDFLLAVKKRIGPQLQDATFLIAAYQLQIDSRN